jgi:hypothetical protein
MPSEKHTHRSSGLGPLDRCLIKGVLEATPDTNIIMCTVSILSEERSVRKVLLNEKLFPLVLNHAVFELQIFAKKLTSLIFTNTGSSDGNESKFNSDV